MLSLLNDLFLNMEISGYNSQKIAILNAVAIMLVLLLHSYYVEAEDFQVALNVQRFTGTKGISGVAVPLFYFISGLLFFKSVASIKDCLNGIRKRTRTLLIPYIIGNLVFVGWYVVMAMTPGVSQFINSNILEHLGLDQPLDSLRFLFIEPAGFHLWFLRDLMVYVVCTPLLYLMGKRIPIISFILLFAILGGFEGCGITYFFLGGAVSLKLGLEQFKKHLTIPVVALTGIIFAANCVMTTIPVCEKIVNNPYAQQIANISGIAFVWTFYDYLNKSFSSDIVRNSLLLVSKYSFFIYLFHEPAFNIVKKIALRIVGVGDTQLVILYFLNPIVMCLVALGVGIIFQKTFPKMYGICVGGR